MTKDFKFDLKVKVQGRIWIRNVCDTSSNEDTPMCQIWQANVNPKESYGPDTKTCQKPYKFYLKVKVQGRIRIMNVLVTSSHGDTPMCQIWLANVKANRSNRSDMKTWQKPLNLILRSKFKVVSGSGMYATHRLIKIHLCAKYGKPMSIQKKVMARTRKHVKNPIKTLRGRILIVNVRDTSSYGDRPMCQIW